MTRGKIVYITENEILSSIEFNGDMYPDDEGYGQEVVNALTKIHTTREYRKYVKHFNKNHHRYKDRMLVFDCIKEICSEAELLDMTTGYFDKWFSDYLYIKNTRKIDAQINTRDKTIAIEPDGICVLYFGRYENECLIYSSGVTVSVSQKAIDICENLGWWLNIYDTDIEIGKSSPLGEDFFFTVSKTDLINDIIRYAEDFDPDEHAEMWIECRGKRGVPPYIRDLIDDADDI